MPRPQPTMQAIEHNGNHIPLHRKELGPPHRNGKIAEQKRQCLVITPYMSAVTTPMKFGILPQTQQETVLSERLHMTKRIRANGSPLK